MTTEIANWLYENFSSKEVMNIATLGVSFLYLKDRRDISKPWRTCTDFMYVFCIYCVIYMIHHL